MVYKTAKAGHHFLLLFTTVTQVTLLLLQPCGQAPPQGICTLFAGIPNVHVGHSFASFRALPKCHILYDGWGGGRDRMGVWD